MVQQVQKVYVSFNGVRLHKKGPLQSTKKRQHNRVSLKHKNIKLFLAMPMPRLEQAPTNEVMLVGRRTPERTQHRLRTLSSSSSPAHRTLEPPNTALIQTMFMFEFEDSHFYAVLPSSESMLVLDFLQPLNFSLTKLFLLFNLDDPTLEE
ncbi:hypothetical protein DVH24_013126 [Malus domestica]|uniref:Uncharacterized protein n=1 Tax=Malus domestica TaxID=3750 RepID=A0A498IQZ4_MALDO|nr:hypothetical protein DVH24_013126 [Malus domestica]